MGKSFNKSSLIVLFYTIFAVSTIITLFIVYKDIDHVLAFQFVVGYAIFLVLSLIYFIIMTVINMRKLKWVHIRNRIYRFMAVFFISVGTTLMYQYFFKAAEIDFYKTFSIAFGVSLGISFFDLAFFRVGDDGHWHLGYYEDNYVIEATGFENATGTWDVFYNELDDEDVVKLFDSKYEIDKDFGVLIFKAKDYEEAEDKFHDWVETVLLPFLNKK